MGAAHDFIFKDNQRVGDFDALYREMADPWGQVANRPDWTNDCLAWFLKLVEGTPLLAPSKSILDIGCGLGAFTEVLTKLFPDAMVYGIDISGIVIRKASKRVPHATFLKVDIRKPSGIGLPHDLILCKNLFWYVLPELPIVLQNIRHLLTPEGDLVIVQYFPQPEEQRYGMQYMTCPEDLIRYLDEAGFEMVTTIEMNRRTNHTWIGWATPA